MADDVYDADEAPIDLRAMMESAPPIAKPDYSSPEALMASVAPPQLDETRLIDPTTRVVEKVQIDRVEEALSAGWRPATTGEVEHWDAQGNDIAFRDASGSIFNVPKDQIDEALGQGLVAASREEVEKYDAANPTVWVKSPTGTIDPVTRDQLPGLKEQGYTQVSDEEVNEAKSGIGSMAKTALMSAADAASFGAFDVALQENAHNTYLERQKERELNPISDIAGTVGGAVGGALVMPVGAPIRAAAAARAATQTGVKALATKIVGSAIAGAVEGAAPAVVRGAVSQEFDVESIAIGTVLGGAVGSAATGVRLGAGAANRALQSATADELGKTVASKLLKEATRGALKVGGYSVGGVPGYIIGEGIEKLAESPGAQAMALKLVQGVAKAGEKTAQVTARIAPRTVGELSDAVLNRQRNRVLSEPEIVERASQVEDRREAGAAVSLAVAHFYGLEAAKQYELWTAQREDFLEEKIRTLTPSAPQGALDRPVSMSATQRKKVSDYVFALDNPIEAARLLSTGNGSTEHLEALQNFYPKVLDAARMSVEELVAQKGAPKAVRLRLDRVLGTKLTRERDPKFVSWLQGGAPPREGSLNGTSPPTEGPQNNVLAARGGIPRKSGPAVSVSPQSPSEKRYR